MFLSPIIKILTPSVPHSLIQLRCVRPSLRIGKEKFELTLNVKHFKKEELRVKARPEYVIIEGKQERKSKKGYVIRLIPTCIISPKVTLSVCNNFIPDPLNRLWWIFVKGWWDREKGRRQFCRENEIWLGWNSDHTLERNKEFLWQTNRIPRGVAGCIFYTGYCSNGCLGPFYVKLYNLNNVPFLDPLNDTVHLYINSDWVFINIIAFHSPINV